MSRQEKYDTVRDAIFALDSVHSKMLNLVIAGELESKDFEQINALYDQLNALSDALAPGCKVPATWKEIVACWEKDC